MSAGNFAHIDMHCHVGWFSDPIAVAREAAEKNLGLLAVTVTPDEYLGLQERLTDEKNVALAAGLHPWWVHGGTDTDALLRLLPHIRFVGEIGLDGSPRHAASWDAQLTAFERICATCVETSDPEAPKVLSIHAVRAADEMLDVLERTRASARCRCVLHWFSGSTEELWRAVGMGCRFSLGERSLATRRGREYARILPAELLLTETDLPEAEGADAGATDVISSLERTVSMMADSRHASEEDMRRLFADNAFALLDV